jgi:competence protein ComEC
MLYLRLWDVQVGNAAYIKTPNGKHIVQDLGIGAFETGLASFSPLFFLKNRMNVNQLDEVIITHPHGDHIRDIMNFDTLNPQILSRPKHLTQKEIISGNRPEDRALVDKYLEISNRYNEDIDSHESPLHVQNNGGAIIQVFMPTLSNNSNINYHSSVTIIEYATSKVILPGDNDRESWQELLGQKRFKEAIDGADVLVASHHGLEAGFCKELFDVIHPKLVVISNGRFNDTSALQRYNQVASGWEVHKRYGGIVEKKCLTTRNDGNIEIAMGWIVEGKKSYLSVTAD